MALLHKFSHVYLELDIGGIFLASFQWLAASETADLAIKSLKVDSKKYLGVDI